MFKNLIDFPEAGKYLTLCLILSLSISPLFSQTGQQRDKDEQREAIEARRIAFYTERMLLTPEEARVFWPLFNEYIRDRDEINATYRDRWEGVEKVSELSAEEAGRFAEDQMVRLEKLVALKREFHDNMKRALTPVKVALMYEAERDFNRMLLREAREKRRHRR
ncbi:MAG TPA: hypothetical protein VLH61_08695 [Bacteroidales bacterium]|nr:hypothetical protein [Bacteroidales bacterium]